MDEVLSHADLLVYMLTIPEIKYHVREEMLSIKQWNANAEDVTLARLLHDVKTDVFEQLNYEAYSNWKATVNSLKDRIVSMDANYKRQRALTELVGITSLHGLYLRANANTPMSRDGARGGLCGGGRRCGRQERPFGAVQFD